MTFFLYWPGKFLHHAVPLITIRTPAHPLHRLVSAALTYIDEFGLFCHGFIDRPVFEKYIPGLLPSRDFPIYYSTQDEALQYHVVCAGVSHQRMQISRRSISLVYWPVVQQQPAPEGTFHAKENLSTCPELVEGLPQT